MARTRTRSSSTARRKRIWSRQRVTFPAVTLAAPQQVNLMSGIEAIGSGAVPLGWTVGPVLLSGLQVRRTSASVTVNQEVVLGIRVGSAAIEPVDQDPALLPMLDWMYWEAFSPTDAATSVAQLTPLGRHLGTQSMRRLSEFQETLWIVAAANAVAPASFEVSCWASTLCILQ